MWTRRIPSAPAHVGGVDHDLAVEAAGPEQRRIEHVGPVGGRDEDDAVVGLEAVHLDQQLVERLLPLVVAAAEPGAAVPADGVDLVDEDDAGRVRLALLEEVAHPAGADADEHLDEVGARHREERPARLAGHRLGEQRLAGARRARPAAPPSGSRPPSRVNFCGSLRNSMISCSSTLASSAPATSAKVTLGVSPASSLAFDLPKANARLPPAWSWRSRKNQRPRITIQGSAAMMIAVMPPLGSLARMGTPASSSRLMNCLAVGHREQHLEALGGPAVLGDRAAELALETLAVEHLDPGDVALVELPAELGVGELLRRVALAAHHLEQRERQQADQRARARGSCSGCPSWCAGAGSGVGLPFIPSPR